MTLPNSVNRIVAMASPEQKIAAIQPSEGTAGINEVSRNARNENENTETQKMAIDEATSAAAAVGADTCTDAAAAADNGNQNGNVRLIIMKLF